MYWSFDSRYPDPIAEVDPLYCIQIYVSGAINQIYTIRVRVRTRTSMRIGIDMCIGMGMGMGMDIGIGMGAV